MRYVAVAIVALEVAMLWILPTFLVGPATIAIGAAVITLGACRVAPAFALALAGGVAMGIVPTLGPALPALAVTLFLVVAGARLGGGLLVSRRAAVPFRIQG